MKLLRPVGHNADADRALRLVHYSARPFKLDPNRTYPEPAYGFKPTGLWLSVEGEHDWRSWCESEQWGLEGLKHVVEVKLVFEPNVLLINTLDDLDRFNADFKKTDDPHNLRNIDWARVKGRWNGLIIAPYQWDRRHDLMWYYGWDCASGVIWNLNCIASVIESAKQ